MPTLHSFWALNIDPGFAVLIPSSPHDLRISMATLKFVEGMNYRPTSVYILPTSKTSDYRALSARDGYACCVLTPGRVEDVSLDLWLPARQGYVVECIGLNSISLLGYYTDSTGKQAARDFKAGEVPVHFEAVSQFARGQRAWKSSANIVVERNPIAEQNARILSGKERNTERAENSRSVANLASAMEPTKLRVNLVQGDTLMMISSNILPRPPSFVKLPTNPDVIKEVASPGEGELFIQPKDKVNVDIEGRVLPHRQLLVRDHIPLSVHVGYSTIPADLQAALLGAKVGSRMTVILPPHRAYDQNGHKSFGVPPNALVQFDITVISIEKDVPPEAGGRCGDHEGAER
ncbi:hypothetical protein FOMPIDRAFT_1056262 [Fomitopsis schrenkii]|uniref:peptidylprolyl isomerase n=1 Tax=Fomitopsis schrenkii TaxID=2126942 RepID=S8DP91_FOMSC|nr:hypothetical protein FOMPIDRAFT_1056262 [Fomitopsis schrenkii]